jgi:hypothetical protein
MIGYNLYSKEILQMTTFTIIPDDSGLQRLRVDDNAPGIVKQVVPAAPARPLQKNRTPDERIVQPINKERRRRQDRRKGDRRIKNCRVLLDTRSHRERRVSQGKRGDDQRQVMRRSINVKA